MLQLFTKIEALEQSWRFDKDGNQKLGFAIFENIIFAIMLLFIFIGFYFANDLNQIIIGMKK